MIPATGSDASLAAPSPVGPGRPFTCLLDESTDTGLALPESFQTIYGSAWKLPAECDQPYVYSNFVVARDGRVSFAEPGHMSGVDVARFDTHDRWLMALLRARADAVLMGDNTLRVEPDHVWTAEFLYPEDAEAFAALRRTEGRRPMPLQVFLSLDGRISGEEAIFAVPDAHVVVATTPEGAARARRLETLEAHVEIVPFDGPRVPNADLVGWLAATHGVTTIVCEGGPRAYASVVADRCLNDEFLTLSPIVIGSAHDSPRPSLVDGIAWSTDDHPRCNLLTVHRSGDFLYLRSRYRQADAPS